MKPRRLGSTRLVIILVLRTSSGEMWLNVNLGGNAETSESLAGASGSGCVAGQCGLQTRTSLVGDMEGQETKRLRGSNRGASAPPVRAPPPIKRLLARCRANVFGAGRDAPKNQVCCFQHSREERFAVRRRCDRQRATGAPAPTAIPQQSTSAGRSGSCSLRVEKCCFGTAATSILARLQAGYRCSRGVHSFSPAMRAPFSSTR